jgi:hypothetical protein
MIWQLQLTKGEICMCENIIIKIKLKNGLIKMKPEQDYQEVINKYTQEGWRFVQIFAPPIGGQGYATFYDLIFEREERYINYENSIIKIKLKYDLIQMKPEQNYQELINKYAQEGWKFVQIFAPPIYNYGKATFYDLIFERKKHVNN